MKKIIILLVFIIPTTLFAQLKVNSGGSTWLYKTLHCKDIISSTDSNTWALNLSGRSRVLKLTGSSNSYTFDLPYYISNLSNSETFPIGMQLSTCAYHTGNIKNCFGMISNVVNDYGYDNERSQSITGIAEGMSSTGQTFGVVGSYDGYGGAGVYGSFGISTPVSDGRFAGYFSGNVKVTGTLVATVVSNSDLRLKEEVRELNEDDEGTLDKLNLLSPISYKYNADLLEPNTVNSTEKANEGKRSNTWTNPVYEKTHFGLVAQELQQVYPDLVYENDNGYLSVNYTELIPVLIQSIKELNAKVEQLSSPLVRKAKIVGEETTDIESAITDIAGMNQNVPNPFSGKTDIAIYLPETVKTAMLYIYDLSGKQMEQHVIEGRGDTIMTIHADKMDAGMYIYSLIADGKVVATKRMIVVK